MISLTVRVPDELAADLELLARDVDRSKAYLASKAIQEYVTREAAFVAGVKRGLEQAERGEFATEAEVKATFDKFKLPKKNGK